MKWPATADELKAAGYKSAGTGTCRSCQKPVIWVETPLGSKMPMVEVAAEKGLFDDGKRYFQSHFADCPNAQQHRRAKHAV